MNDQQLEKKSKREVLLEKGISVLSVLSSFLGPVGQVSSASLVIGLGFLKFNDEVKQRNLLAFVEELKNFIEKNKKELNEHKEFLTKSEEEKERLEEIFFFIIEKVQQIKSRKKREIFARILVKEFTSSVKSDFSKVFLEIISQIDEKEVEILGKLREIKKEATKENGKLNEDEYLKEIHDIFNNSKEVFKITKELYKFYIQDLISKSLVIDESMNRFSTRPLEFVKITDFGMNFLNYIEDKEEE